MAASAAAAASSSSSEGFVGVPAALPLDKAPASAAAASASGSGGGDRVVDCGLCAICLDKIALQETALVKGCEHAYCVTCILRWASYKQNPLCPQCKHPFEFLSVHRSLDGCLHDYLFEESVCLLLRAAWFEPLIVEPHEEALEEDDFYHQYQYDDDEDDLDDAPTLARCDRRQQRGVDADGLPGELPRDPDEDLVAGPTCFAVQAAAGACQLRLRWPSQVTELRSRTATSPAVGSLAASARRPGLAAGGRMPLRGSASQAGRRGFAGAVERSSPRSGKV